MKKINTVLLCSLLLCACSEHEYVHSSEPRSQVYYGQPVADVYENFGTPTKGVRLSDNERILIWISQEVEKDWAYRYLRACTVKIHLRDERVINWSAEGQGCVISSNSDGEEINQLIESQKSGTPSTPSLPTDAFDGATQTNAIGGTLPADAFNGTASLTYTAPKTGLVIPNPASGRQPSFTAGSSTAPTTGGSALPSDAFESGLFSSGNTSTAPAYNAPIPQQPSAQRVIQQKSTGSSWFSSDDSEDEWGLFDS